MKTLLYSMKNCIFILVKCTLLNAQGILKQIELKKLFSLWLYGIFKSMLIVAVYFQSNKRFVIFAQCLSLSGLAFIESHDAQPRNFI